MTAPGFVPGGGRVRPFGLRAAFASLALGSTGPLTCGDGRRLRNGIPPGGLLRGGRICQSVRVVNAS